MCLLSLQEGMLWRSSTAVSVMCVSSTINTGGTAIIDRNDVLIYDSLYNVVDEDTIKLLERLFSRKIRGKNAMSPKAVWLKGLWFIWFCINITSTLC